VKVSDILESFTDYKATYAPTDFRNVYELNVSQFARYGNGKPAGGEDMNECWTLLLSRSREQVHNSSYIIHIFPIYSPPEEVSRRKSPNRCGFCMKTRE
jgi:hypothetical protein